MSEVRILCTANCLFRNNTGYYGLCNHLSRKDLVPYGGIDRLYIDKCDKYIRITKEITNNA